LGLMANSIIVILNVSLFSATSPERNVAFGTAAAI
jgi:hypothetical protein